MSWRSHAAGTSPQRWLMVAAALPPTALLLLELAMIGDTLAWRASLEPAVVGQQRQTDSYATRINQANWFGTVQHGTVASADKRLRETNLDLTLRAVFIAGGSSRASAIIERADGTAEVTKTGEELVPGVILAEVFADRVVMVSNGIRQQLYFPTAGESDSLAADEATQGSSADNGAATMKPPTDEQKRANILQRLEELRARGAG